MKKIFSSLILIFMAAFMLTACGSVDDTKPVVYELFDNYNYTSFPDGTLGAWSSYTRTGAPDVWEPDNWSIGVDQIILDAGLDLASNIRVQNSAFINNKYNSSASCTVKVKMSRDINTPQSNTLGLILRATDPYAHYAFVYTLTAPKKASYDYYPVIFFAVTPGADGNSITLTFNGTTDTITSVVNAWNTDPAHSTNQVSYAGQAGSYIPPPGTATLTGGHDAATAVAASIVYDTVTFTAETEGAAGNTIKLLFNGTDTLDTVVNAWNTANPANKVGYDDQPGTYKPALGTVTLTGGSDAGALSASVVYKTVTFSAATPFAAGNSIALVFTGSNTIQAAVDAWNIPAHSTNQVNYTGTAPTTYMPIAGTYTLVNGRDPGVAVAASVRYGTVTFTAVTPGAAGNSIALVFDGIKTIDTVVNAWNTDHPANTVGYTGGLGTDKPAAGTAILVNGSDVGSVAIQKVNSSGVDVPADIKSISTPMPATFNPAAINLYGFSVINGTPLTLKGYIGGALYITAADNGTVHTSGKTGFFLGNAHGSSVSRYFIWEP